MPDSSDTSQRRQTRLLCLYDLVGQITAGADAETLTSIFPFGRFKEHIHANQAVLPTVLLAQRLDAQEHGFREILGGLPLAQARIAVLTTPHADATLALDLSIDGEVDSGAVARALAMSCFQRDSINFAGQPLLVWLSQRLGAEVRFGRNVHQILCPGGRLLEEVLAAGPGDAETVPLIIKEIVYRATLTDSSPSRLAVRSPSGLNSRGRTLVAHGRGVSLVAGWEEHVENCFGLIAAVLQSSLTVLQHTRHLAFETLEINRRAAISTPSEAQALISTLSGSLNESQLGLAFGVEAYVDSLLIPELIVEGYQTSLREAMGINLALENSSRMLRRLTSVIDARAAALDAAIAERAEHRIRRFSTLIAVTTLIALPPALLLAFFGVNSIDVDSTRSILDLEYYWPAYLWAWAPFIALVSVGYLMRFGPRARLSGQPAGRGRRLPKQRESGIDDRAETAGDLGAPRRSDPRGGASDLGSL